METPIDTASGYGATAVITHRIRPGLQADYEARIEEILPLVKVAPGHLDVQWIKPISGITSTNTILLRFDTTEHLRKWMESESRTRWIETVSPLFVTGDDFFIRSGLDFWFMPDGAQAAAPKRWKQFILTWSAIFPLAFVLPFLVGPLLRSVGLGSSRILMTAGVTGVAVFLMAYVVMPHYTRLVKRWLFS